MESQLDDPVDVETDGLDEEVEQVDWVTEESEKGQEEHAQTETDLAQSPDADIHAG